MIPIVTLRELYLSSYLASSTPQTSDLSDGRKKSTRKWHHNTFNEFHELMEWCFGIFIKESTLVCVSKENNTTSNDNLIQELIHFRKLFNHFSSDVSTEIMKLLQDQQELITRFDNVLHCYPLSPFHSVILTLFVIVISRRLFLHRFFSCDVKELVNF